MGLAQTESLLLFYRLRSNISRKKLAHIVGCSERTLKRYEEHKALPSLYMALKLSYALLTPVDRLFYLDDDLKGRMFERLEGCERLSCSECPKVHCEGRIG